MGMNGRASIGELVDRSASSIIGNSAIADTDQEKRVERKEKKRGKMGNLITNYHKFQVIIVVICFSSQCILSITIISQMPTGMHIG